jgi:hypothetical protein
MNIQAEIKALVQKQTTLRTELELVTAQLRGIQEVLGTRGTGRPLKAKPGPGPEAARTLPRKRKPGGSSTWRWKSGQKTRQVILEALAVREPQTAKELVASCHLTTASTLLTPMVKDGQLVVQRDPRVGFPPRRWYARTAAAFEGGVEAFPGEAVSADATM